MLKSYAQKLDKNQKIFGCDKKYNCIDYERKWVRKTRIAGKKNRWQRFNGIYSFSSWCTGAACM